MSRGPSGSRKLRHASELGYYDGSDYVGLPRLFSPRSDFNVNTAFDIIANSIPEAKSSVSNASDEAVGTFEDELDRYWDAVHPRAEQKPQSGLDLVADIYARADKNAKAAATAQPVKPKRSFGQKLAGLFVCGASKPEPVVSITADATAFSPKRG